ncbi:hypothetical protein ECZU41_13870 [Escherichia coli]|nr:hypothetical protein ECZU41_13870 [Escherichia coli]
MTEDDVMPEALRRFEEMVEEAARNAEAASQSSGGKEIRNCSGIIEERGENLRNECS